MQIIKRNVGLRVDDSLMRVYVAEPEPAGQYPGILFYCDIFQLGRPITLLADRLAGYGYVVAAPEIFHRTEPIGTGSVRTVSLKWVFIPRERLLTVKEHYESNKN